MLAVFHNVCIFDEEAPRPQTAARLIAQRRAPVDLAGDPSGLAGSVLDKPPLDAAGIGRAGEDRHPFAVIDETNGCIAGIWLQAEVERAIDVARLLTRREAAAFDHARGDI